MTHVPADYLAPPLDHLDVRTRVSGEVVHLDLGCDHGKIAVRLTRESYLEALVLLRMQGESLGLLKEGRAHG
jgi:hypothetical protein